MAQKMMKARRLLVRPKRSDVMASFEHAIQAFEERHSHTLTGSATAEAWNWSDLVCTEHSSFYPKASPIDRYQLHPAPAAQLASICTLALHLCRGRSSPYKPTLKRNELHADRACFWVPQSPWEFAFGCLDLWINDPTPKLRILTEEGVLHPAARTMIQYAYKAFSKPVVYVGLSREELDELSDRQIRRNELAKWMRAWQASTQHKTAVKAWTQKHEAAKRAFLEHWSAPSRCPHHMLIRVDLKYPLGDGMLSSWKSIPDYIVRGHAELLRNELSESLSSWNDGQACLAHVEPYVLLDGGWLIHVVLKVPHAINASMANICRLQDLWQRTAQGYVGNPGCTWGGRRNRYRFISQEHMMLAPYETQLADAASYLFDTRLFADTSLNAAAQAYQVITKAEMHRFGGPIQ